MPISPAILQRRLAQVGVIRLGETRISKNNKPYPAKLDTFRVTSPSRQLVDAVAALLGGTVKPWQNKTGPEFEVVTTATEIQVLVPPQQIDPNFELWGNGFRARMCDGVTERLRSKPCLCEAAARQRYESKKMPWPADGRFERDPRGDCKPTTRLSLMIADIPSGVGTFKLESHGWNAAAELPMLADAIAAAPAPIPATLRLEQRESGRLVFDGGEEKVDPRKYAVPVLDFFGLFTPRQAFSGQIGAAVQAAIAGGVPQQAIAAAPAVDPDVLAGLWRDARAATSTAELTKVWNAAGAAGVVDAELKAFIQSKGAELKAAAAPAAVPAPAGPVAEPVDAEIEPDRDDTWTAILREAGKVGWNLPAVEEKYRARMGHDPAEDAATGWKLAEFLRALKAGEVR